MNTSPLTFTPMARLPTFVSAPGEMFRCETMHCGMLGRRCVERQIEYEEATRKPVALAMCQARKCAQGRAIREAMPVLEQQSPRPVQPRPRSSPAPLIAKTCERQACGKQFSTRWMWERCCSPTCKLERKRELKRKRYVPKERKKKAAPPSPRPCVECGNTFTPKRPDAQRCSKKCGLAPFQRARHERLLAEMRSLKKRCERRECGAAIEPDVNAAGFLNVTAYAAQRFCSVLCRQVERVEQMWGAESARRYRNRKTIARAA